MMALWLISVALIAAPPKVDHFVKVEGRTYRVRVKGNEIRVFDKGIAWKKSLEQRERMRRAVNLATGCHLTDDYWAEGDPYLTGFLDCSGQ